METKPVLVIGATGYVGGRLVPRLLASGHGVRAFARSLAKLRGRPWSSHPEVEPVEGDLLDSARLAEATEGVGVVFHLAHSMVEAGEDSSRSAYRGAANLARAAEKSGVERIVYLDSIEGLSAASWSLHLRWRRDIARILRSRSTPVTVLRSSAILGSGSALFEMLRHLVDRLPLLPAPPWTRTPFRPICIRNVLDYLTGCIERPETSGGTFDITGPRIVTFLDLIRLYTAVAGLRPRGIVPVRSHHPFAHAFFINLATPLPLKIARTLTEALRDEVICSEGRIREIIPVELVDCEEAIRRAIEKTDLDAVQTRWSDAGLLRRPPWALCTGSNHLGTVILECGYRAVIRASREEIWEKVVRIGGETRWYYAEALWRVRGWIDGFVGGVGLKRGRRHPRDLLVGDALDFWRVLDVDPPRRLVLIAEMKTPGEAILEFHIRDAGKDQAEIRMLSRFVPEGLPGLVYWYGLFPFHEWIFKGMLKTVAGLIGKPVVAGPFRFTPKLPPACGPSSDRTP